MHSEDDDLTVIVLCNLSISSVPTELADGLAALAMGEDPEPLRLAASPLDPDAARHLAGEYRFGEDFYVPNTSMRIVAADGQLRVDGAPPGALLRLATGGADGDAVFIPSSTVGPGAFRQ